jgi:esterase/lipase superfamily enzyme
MQERYLKWYSPSLHRDMEMLVYGHGGRPVIAFPTSMGRYYQNKDFKLIDSAAWFVDNGLITIYCPDSVDEDSWYNKQAHPADRVNRHMQYDAYIHNEVLPLAQRETGWGQVITAGASFGAYHAVNFAFRYPMHVSATLNMGGAFDIRMHLGGYYDENAYYNNPIDFVRDLNHPNLWQMSIVLGAGEHDFCLQHNYKMSEVLSQKGVKHWLDVKPGGNHDWPVWRDMFPHYLSEVLK